MGKMIKILVVDDHPNTASTLARALSQLGPNVDVRSATNGHEALEQVNDGAVDILLTDMIMPEMTGLELIEKLHGHPAGRPAVSFLMTAYDVPGLKVTAQRLKVKEVVIKPVHPERVRELVTKAINEIGQAIAVTAKKDAPARKTFNILIADDHPENVTLLARYMVNEGYSYIGAKDGLDALEKVRSQMPDLVLLDVNMPHKDGFAVLKEIREDPATEHIPVIILTAARLDSKDVQSGFNMGADDYVTKPFDRRELLARIHSKLRVKEAEDVIRRRNRELNLLPEIGKDLSARPNIDELTDIVLRRTVETLGAMQGHVFIFNGKVPLHKEYHLDAVAPSSPETQLPPLNALLEKIKGTRQSLIIADTENDVVWQGSPDNPIKSAIIVPMFGRHELIGVLILTHEQSGYFNLDHQLLLQAIASQASIAVENAQLYSSVAKEQLRLNAVLQTAADAILVFDADGCLSLLNPAGKQLFTNYDAKLGLPLARGQGYDALIELLETANESSKPTTGEFISPKKQAFSVLLTPIENGGCVAILHDVTHFKDLERVKNEFVATASHDLRNPITSIKGYAQLIMFGGGLNETQTDFVQRILRGTEHMSELVENMLDLAKMDLSLERKMDEVDIHALLIQTADEFKPQADMKGQKLRLEETAASPRVRGDAFQLGQVLHNLVGNAIKYTPNEGAVKLSLQADGCRVNIRVQDTGYGIPSGDLPHIFDRFYRVRNSGHDDIEGNGLGLAIVKAIAEQHGGDVSVESELGKGSCFTLTLPVAMAEAAPIEINESEVRS
jgi:signal transduction histidine kinase/DNA-binding response OmpR family regulator